MSLDFFRRVFLGMSGRLREGDSLSAAKLESNESRASLGLFGLSVGSDLWEFLEDRLCLVLSDFSLVGESTPPPAECWRLDDLGNSGKSLPRNSLRLASVTPKKEKKKKTSPKMVHASMHACHVEMYASVTTSQLTCKPRKEHGFRFHVLCYLRRPIARRFDRR